MLAIHNCTYVRHIRVFNTLSVLLFVAARALCPDVNEFLGEAAITKAAAGINVSEDAVLYDGIQSIFPQLVLVCDDRAVISGWMVSACMTGNEGSRNAQVQIWRPVSAGEYKLVDFVELIHPSRTISRNLYQFEPKTAMNVKSGDVMGLYNPPFVNANWLVYHGKAVGDSGDGVENYVTSTDLPCSLGSTVSLMLGPKNKGTDYPLVKPLAGRSNTLICRCDGHVNLCRNHGFAFVDVMPHACNK